MPGDVQRQLITGLTPGAGYDVRTDNLNGKARVTVTPGRGQQADGGGVLVIQR